LKVNKNYTTMHYLAIHFLNPRVGKEKATLTVSLGLRPAR